MKPFWTPATLRRLLLDLINAELARLRPGQPWPWRALGSGARGADAESHPGARFGDDVGPLQTPHSGDRAVVRQQERHHGASDHGEENPEELEFADLGLDSLERLDLATTVAVQFHLFETGLDRALLEQPRLSDWIGVILDSRSRWDQAISFQTSGSSGRPRMHAHPLALLEEEIDYFATLLEGHCRLLATVPSHRIYGFLFTVLLPSRLGLPLLDARGLLPLGVLGRTQAHDLLVAYPSFLELATRGPSRVAPAVTLVTSTAPCAPALWRRLQESGFTRILEVYGATETAGIGVRDDSRLPAAGGSGHSHPGLACPPTHPGGTTPRAITIGAQLPRSRLGKPMDW